MSQNSGNAMFTPGDFVRHPQRPDWGLGQIQSIVGHRITNQTILRALLDLTPEQAVEKAFGQAERDNFNRLVASSIKTWETVLMDRGDMDTNVR